MNRFPGRLPAAVLLAVLAAPAFAMDTDLSWEDGAEVEWGERRSLAIGGRLHYDIARFDDDVTVLEDDSDFRRARVSMRGRYDDWRLSVDYDSGIAEGWRSLYLQYAGIGRQRITVGQHVAPFSLDELGSSNDLTFLERSLASALSPGMLVGASWRTWGEDWTLAAGVFGDEINDQERRQIDGTSFVGRATYAPFGTGRRMLHLGLAQEYRSVDEGALVRVATRPESRLASARLVATPGLAGVEEVWTTGVEALGIVEGLRMQGEYMRMSLNGAATEPDFSGGYLQVSAMLTGERYRYSGSRGVVGGIRPRHRFGALEASARFSTLDLEDDGVTGGEQTQFTVALSWYLNQQLRINLNYSLYDADPNRNGVAEEGSIFMVRLQAVL